MESKAVLIMDMPEQVCQKCTLCYETENDDEYLCLCGRETCTRRSKAGLVPAPGVAGEIRSSRAL